ncbi:hypothetical protein FACS1894184_15960 [Clostridia bacterium]|nr:hypothetical protein FACS1894184_15960 [Clostridia bacterium]
MLYPNGLYHMLGDPNAYYFLGHRNSCAYISVFLAFFTCLKSSYISKKIDVLAIISIAISVVTVIAVWSATCITALLFAIVFYILQSTKASKAFTATNTFILSLLISSFIIFSPFVRYLSFWVEGVLGKNLTLSSRTYLWQKAIQYIKQSPIYGYGIEDTQVIYTKFTLYHLHNTWLEYFYLGGVVTLLFVSILVLMATINVDTGTNDVYHRMTKTFYAFYMIWCIGEASTVGLGMNFLMLLSLLSYDINRHSFDGGYHALQSSNRSPLRFNTSN